MKRRFDVYLDEIPEAIDKAERYTNDMDYEAFSSDEKTVDAVLRNLEVIGEAVSQLQDDLKEKYEKVPWAEIKQFRNIAIHKYHSVDLETTWNIVEEELDELREQVKHILDEETD